MKCPTDTILFDIDGTLLDPKYGITKCAQYSLRYFGINEENLDSLEKFIGPPIDEAYRDFYNFSEEQVNTAIEKFRERYGNIGMFENEVYPDIPQLLSKLKAKGKKLMVVTTKYYGYAIEILKHYGLHDYFDFVAGSKFDNTRSQKADIIRYALNTLNLTASSQMVMIGDRKYDIIGARKAGLKSIGVLYGYGSREEIQQADPHYIVKNVQELQDILL